MRSAASATWRAVLPLSIPLLSLAAGASALRGQEHARFQVEPRMGFLVTFAEGHPDRPVVGMDLGVRVLESRPRGRPGITLTGGVGVGFAEFFAEAQSESFRILGGVQIPWLLGQGAVDGTTASGARIRGLEIVPNVQGGYLTSNGGDQRDGLIFRTALGLRVPIGSGPMYLTFEPFALVWLPDGDPLITAGAPSDAFTNPGSNAALELGILQLGWRF